jgi:hypothetical protein
VERFVRLLVTSAVGFLPASGLAAASATGLGDRLGGPWTLAAAALATAALVAGWPAMARLPERHSARLTLALTGAAALALAAFWSGGAAAVLVAIALGFPAVFVRELTRPAPRPDLVRSVTGTTSGVMAVAAMGLWMTASRMEHFEDLAVLGGLGIAAGCLGLGLGRAWPAPSWRALAGALMGLALAGAAGAGGSYLVVTHWWAGAAVAAATGAGAIAVWLVADSRGLAGGPWRWRDAALVALPLAVAAVPVWTAQLIR